jgi:hypothetical protein
MRLQTAGGRRKSLERESGVPPAGGPETSGRRGVVGHGQVRMDSGVFGGRPDVESLLPFYGYKNEVIRTTQGEICHRP